MEGAPKNVQQLFVVPDSDSEDGGSGSGRVVMVHVRDCRNDDGDDDFTNEVYDYNYRPSSGPPTTTSPQTPPYLPSCRPCPPSPKTPPALKRMLPSRSPSPLPVRQKTARGHAVVDDVASEKNAKKARVMESVENFKGRVDNLKEKLSYSMVGRDPWQPPYPHPLLTGTALRKAKQDYREWLKQSRITRWQEGESQPCPA